MKVLIVLTLASTTLLAQAARIRMSEAETGLEDYIWSDTENDSWSGPGNWTWTGTDNGTWSGTENGNWTESSTFSGSGPEKREEEEGKLFALRNHEGQYVQHIGQNYRIYSITYKSRNFGLNLTKILLIRLTHGSNFNLDILEKN